MDVENKKLKIKYISGPLGVRRTNSDNTLIFEKLGWKPKEPLKDGISKTYKRIHQQVLKQV